MTGAVVTDCFWWKYEVSVSAKPEMELIVKIAVIYLRIGERYDVGLFNGLSLTLQLNKCNTCDYPVV